MMMMMILTTRCKFCSSLNQDDVVFSRVVSRRQLLSSFYIRFVYVVLLVLLLVVVPRINYKHQNFVLSVTAQDNNNDNNHSNDLSECQNQYCTLLDKAPSVTLHNGVRMPLLQLGTAQLVIKCNVDPTIPDRFMGLLPERTYQQIELALQCGIRAYDTAYIYRSHYPMAHVFGEWYRTGQLHNRNELWIQTKVFHPNATQMTFGISHMPSLDTMTPQQITQRTIEHVETSLLQLNVGYIDLLLLHWPSGKKIDDDDDDDSTTNDDNSNNNSADSSNIDWTINNEYNNRQRRIAAWRVLEQVYEKGWARAIGVSNFSVKHLQQLVQDGATIKPMVNQIEGSITIQYPDIVQYCISNHIIPQAYSPFRGGLTEIPASLKNDMIQKYNKIDFGQISIKYLIQLGYSVVYLSNNQNRMISNMDIFDFNISQSDMNILQQYYHPDGGWGLPSPNDLL